MSVVIGKANKR